MAIATLTKIEKTFGQRVIFDKLDFAIDRGERVGLIGDNGSGKTTLFKVLLEQMPVDMGTVAVAKSVTLGHLPQDPVFNAGNTVIDEAELAFARLHELSHRLRQIEHDMAHPGDADMDRLLAKYQHVMHEFDLAGGYAWRHRLEATLLGVGLDANTWEQQVDTLSGGQRSRLALAKLLVGENDLLLLDEPTNHLDLTAIAWLEEYLAAFPGAVLIISHDRYLLDRLATRIVWLTQSRLKSFPGNYSAFVQQRQLQELTQQRAYEEQQADIDKQAEFIRRFGAGQRSREAKGREKRLDRLLKSDAMIQNVAAAKKIRVSLQTEQRAGDRVLLVKELAKSYEQKVLWKEISLEIRRGERVGIMGPNGSGKTTMLEVLLGRREADAGEIRWGANLNIGYYDQRLGDFDPDHTVAEEVQAERKVSPKDLRAVLAMMLFRGDEIDKPIRLLSGGERARVAMAQLLVDRPNVLVLDEPTNHLDIQSCEALETALSDFAGTILCVSHDRYFLDRIMSRLLILEPPGIEQFAGNYTEWVRKRADRAAAEKAREKEAKANPPKRVAAQSKAKKAKADNPWLRPFGRLSMEELERQIMETETALADRQAVFGDADVARDPQRSRKLNDDYAALGKKLKQLEEEYFTRSEK
ncbi:MAG TPA: ABC-F family ATP-binding cassette domain-containing protein [Tepidisphaeraceae bacterium]|jgi:ATP-binding cassette subfamily F protein 3|nr:ABC-F family ATP-binding cassette domain-containing protein [Tepidisphaeraceae bacterium]